MKNKRKKNLENPEAVAVSTLATASTSGGETINALPDELILSLALYLDYFDLVQLGQTSKRLRRITQDFYLLKKVMSRQLTESIPSALDTSSKLECYFKEKVITSTGIRTLGRWEPLVNGGHAHGYELIPPSSYEESLSNYLTPKGFKFVGNTPKKERLFWLTKIKQGHKERIEKKSDYNSPYRCDVGYSSSNIHPYFALPYSYYTDRDITVAAASSFGYLLNVFQSLYQGVYDCGEGHLNGVAKELAKVLQRIAIKQGELDVLIKCIHEFQNDKEIVRLATKCNYKEYEHIVNDTLKLDSEIIEPVIEKLFLVKDNREQDLRILESLPETIKNDYEFAEKIIKRNPLALDKLGRDIKGNERLVKLAISIDRNALKFADYVRFQNATRFAEKLIAEHDCPEIISQFSDDVRKNRAIGMLAISKWGYEGLLALGKGLKVDKALLAALIKHPKSVRVSDICSLYGYYSEVDASWQYAIEKETNYSAYENLLDKELAIHLVIKQPSCLQKLPVEFEFDEEIKALSEIESEEERKERAAILLSELPSSSDAQSESGVGMPTVESFSTLAAEPLKEAVPDVSKREMKKSRTTLSSKLAKASTSSVRPGFFSHSSKKQSKPSGSTHAYSFK